jgi:hypothetical protein
MFLECIYNKKEILHATRRIRKKEKLFIN